MKKLAIIGRPNVGKSSLFNRFAKERDAITSDLAGTTRDVKKRSIELFDKKLELLDTGGLDKGNELFDKIKEMSIRAAHEADIVLFMVDGREFAAEEDKRLFYELEKMGKSVALVVNKLDNDKQEERIWEFYSFGTENIFAISVSHNRRVTRLMQWIYDQLPKNEPEQFIEKSEFDPIYDLEFDSEDSSSKKVDESSINVAIIGRVNVGKSSLLNALLNEERSVVSSVAGTTIDPIDEQINYKDKKITFIDTAGIRKRGKIMGIEKYALMRTEDMLEKADLALLVLDASEPFIDLDEKIAGLVDKHRLGCLVVLNKWDISNSSFKEIEAQFRDRFKFLHFAPFVTISALSKQRVHKIFDKILTIHENYTQRIPTSKLNKTIEEAIMRHSLPSPNGQMLRIYYATQYEIRPPRIALIMNRPKFLHFSYRRYLTNYLREKFNFEGSPLLFKARSKESADAQKKE